MEERKTNIKAIKSKNLAGALVWLGFSYTLAEDGAFLFERSYDFDLAFRALHSTKSIYGNKNK